MIWFFASAMAAPADELASWVTTECGAASVEVLELGVPEPLPEGSWYFSGLPCRSAPQIRVSVVADGVEVFNRVARPRLDVQIASLIVSEPVSAGDVVRYTAGTVSVDKLHGQPAGEGDWRARRSLRVGEPLTTATVEPLPDALRGVDLDLVATRGPLNIYATGTLLTDANVGDRVKAMNHATKVAVTGILVDPLTIAVD